MQFVIMYGMVGDDLINARGKFFFRTVPVPVRGSPNKNA